jgi:transcriptional regulator with XRE-family HTH domain
MSPNLTLLLTDTAAALGQFIRAERRKLGISLKALAATADICPPYLSAFETGKCPPPSDEKLGRIETALRLPPGSLVLRAALIKAHPMVKALIADRGAA